MRLLPLFALCLGFFMVIMDITVVNVVVPTIRQALNADISWLQWIVDAYALSFAGLLMTSGHLGDQLGAKRLYQLGLVVFIIASVFCGVAQAAWFLVIFRLAQGVGAALMMPTSLALIHTIYTSHQQQARAIGIWAGIGGIAAAAGPILGAFAAAVMSWRAAFLINVPFGLVALLLTWRYVCPADKSPRQGLHFDRWGPVSAIITISALAFVLIEIGRLGVASPWVISAFIITAGGAITFIISQLNVRNPILPLNCFKHPHFTIAATIGVIINIGFYGELFILPLYFHNLRHYSILTIGFALFPLMATTGISSYLAGKWIGKVGPHWPIRIGLVIGACGFFSLLIAQHNGLDYMILIIPFILIGSGIAITMPSCTIAIMKSVTAQRKGLASGVFNTCRQIGSLIGVGLFGTIIALSSDFIAGMHITLYIAGGLYLLGALIAALGMHQT